MRHVDVPRLLVAVAGALALYAVVSLDAAGPADAARLTAPAAPAGVQALSPAQEGAAAQVAPFSLTREGHARYQLMVSQVDGYIRRAGAYQRTLALWARPWSSASPASRRSTTSPGRG